MGFNQRLLDQHRKAAVQNDQLLFLVPGLKAYDVLGVGFIAASGGSSSGSTGQSMPTTDLIAQLDALKGQQSHIPKFSAYWKSLTA
jgi:hypothetical protein